MNDSITNNDSQLKPKNNQNIFELLLRFFLGSVLLLVVLFALGLGLTRLWFGPQLENILVDSQKLNNWLPNVVVEKKIKVEINTAKIDWSEWLTPSLVLKNISIKNGIDQEIIWLSRVESSLGFRSFVSFLQSKPILGDVNIDKATVFVEKNQLNKESNFTLAGLAFIFSGRGKEVSIFDFSPNQIQINQIKISYDKKGLNAGGASEFLNFGSVKIQNKPNQLKILFEELNTNSLLSIASITGHLPDTNVKLQGSVKSLIFKLPKNLSEESMKRDDLFDSIAVEAQFEDLGVTKIETDKGFLGLNGSFLFNSSGINFSFFSNSAEFFLPGTSSGSSLRFSDVTGRVGFDSSSLKKILMGEYTELSIKVHELNLSNSDIKIKSRGMWTIDSQGNENADLKGEVAIDNVEAISDYLPKKMSQKARNWFKRGFKYADDVNGSFLYKGPIKNISNLSSNKKGKFIANLNVKNMDLLFSSKWPLIRKINAEIEFKNEHFRLVNASGFLADSKLVSVHGEIPNIFSKTPELALSGEVSGLLENFIYVSNNSPIKKWLWNVTENAFGEGDVGLDLSLKLDLKKIKNSKVLGILKFDNNSLILKENFIPLKKIRGEINFSEKSLSRLNIESEILGGKVNFTSSNSSSFKRGIDLNAEGILQGKGFEDWINKTFEIALEKKVVGSSEYQAGIRLFEGSVNIAINTDLRGLLLDLPKPIFKDHENSWELKANFLYRPNLNNKTWQRIWDIRASNGLIFLLDEIKEDLTKLANKTSTRKKFAILFDDKNSDGFQDEVFKEFSSDTHNKILVNNSTFDLKNWIVFVSQSKNSSKANFFKNLKNNSLKFELGTNDLKIGNYSFTNFYAQSIASVNGFSGIFKSLETTGVFNWNPSIKEIKVHLSHYHQKDEEKNNDLAKSKLTNIDFFTDGKDWPSINLFVDEFKSFNFEGKLALSADYLTAQKVWSIEKIEIFSEMTRLEASGFWNKPISKNKSQALADNEAFNETITELDFRIETKNGANVLEDLGYSGLLADSGGIVSGQLKWMGSPLDFNVKNTIGDVSLDIQKGKFLKVEPGLARLIGVLNLQSLPRRIKLDFQDIFSEGFSFDKLRGNVAIDKGIANTSNLRVIGTQASIFLEGNVNLLNQTQDMRVLVLPELNAGLASLGYVLVNPAVGLGSFLAQYILRDPLRKILAYEYKLKGSWNSPVVEVIPQKNTSKDEPSIYQNP